MKGMKWERLYHLLMLRRSEKTSIIINIAHTAVKWGMKILLLDGDAYTMGAIYVYEIRKESLDGIIKLERESK